MVARVPILWPGKMAGWLGGLILAVAVSPAASAEEPPAAGAKEARVEGYRVELPGGATIELLGIGDHPQDPEARWWKPDGKPLETPVDRESFISGDLRRELTAPGQGPVLLREVAVQVRIDPLSSPRLSASADGAAQGGMRHGANGLMRGSYSFTARKEPLKISVAYSGGKWARRASADVGGKSDEKDVKFEPLVSENGSVHGSLTHPWLTDETRIVAFHRKGTRHLGVANSLSQRGKHATHGFRFDDIPLPDIAAIHLESHPTTTIEFRSVALKAGEEADIKILVDGKPMSESPSP